MYFGLVIQVESLLRHLLMVPTGVLVACLLRCTHIETSTFHFQTGIVRNHNEERVLCGRRTRVSQQQSRVRPSHGLRRERKRIYTTTSLESEVRTGKCTITIHIMSKYGNYPGRLPYLQLVNMTWYYKGTVAISYNSERMVFHSLLQHVVLRYNALARNIRIAFILI